MRKAIAFTALASIVAASLVMPAFAKSIEQEIISIANNDLVVERRAATRRAASSAKPAQWKTTVYNWKTGKKTVLPGYVPPSKK